MSPLRVVLQGLLSGFAASLLLSLLARAVPGMEAAGSKGGQEKSGKTAPSDPFDPSQVREWQARAQSPAAAEGPAAGGGEASGPPSPVSPASVLALPQAPGPEGLAEQFAYKIAAGVFGVDISRWLGPAGMATHLTYGSLWGALYGIARATFHAPTAQAGAAFGVLVWLAGPVTLVPAMKLMPPPWRESPPRALLLAVGHVAYGLAVAATFDVLQRGAAQPHGGALGAG